MAPWGTAAHAICSQVIPGKSKTRPTT